MHDIRAMIQDELREALTGLMPPPPAVAIPIASTIPSVADASPTATVPTPLLFHMLFLSYLLSLLLMIVEANPQIVLKLCLLYK